MCVTEKYSLCFDRIKSNVVRRERKKGGEQNKTKKHLTGSRDVSKEHLWEVTSKRQPTLVKLLTDDDAHNVPTLNLCCCIAHLNEDLEHFKLTTLARQKKMNFSM
jgi:hypothetical protein